MTMEANSQSYYSQNNNYQSLASRFDQVSKDIQEKIANISSTILGKNGKL